jgi:predicted Zn-dependent protease
MKALVLPLLPALVLAAAGCTSYVNPATGKSHTIAFSRDDELKWGQQVDGELRKEPGFLNDRTKLARVERIGRKVVAVSDATDWEYRFAVVNTDVPNAFAAPGGYIYVTNGLLAMTAGNDDELAGVLAHEAGHIAAKHTALRMHRATMMQGAVAVAAALSGEKNAENVALLGSVVSSFVLLGNSREMEYEADKLGVRYAHRSGYRPEGIVSFFQKLEKMEADSGGGGRLPNFLSTHPSTPDRVEQVRKQIRKLRAKEAARTAAGADGAR